MRVCIKLLTTAIFWCCHEEKQARVPVDTADGSLAPRFAVSPGEEGPVLSGGITPAKETPAEEMPRRGLVAGGS
jgi:hypothetical protein